LSSLVSILIPCFNAERWVAQAIESALAQTWPNKEVIVVDDGSTDDSLAIIRGYEDRIRWETGPNRGGNAARNRLLELASGEWLQYLDADDVLLPDKVAQQMGFLANHWKADVAYSPVLLQYENQEPVRPVPNPFPIDANDLWTALVRWHTPQTGGFLYRRKAVLTAGGWKRDQPCCQDNAMTLALLMHGAHFLFCPPAGAVYRIWSNETVSRRRSDLIRRHRLEIITEAEEFLRQTGQLNAARLDAINQARFEIARITWLVERDTAREIISSIRCSQRFFVPGASVPAAYRVIYMLFGFNIAERVAALLRRFSGRSAFQNILIL
jgi:glycosyltransferase involved in cell wall biosynthesis